MTAGRMEGQLVRGEGNRGTSFNSEVIVVAVLYPYSIAAGNGAALLLVRELYQHLSMLFQVRLL